MSAARSNRPTLAQVARHAHVSTATASMALRADPRISPETTRRVLVAAQALGYQPDPELTKLMSYLRAHDPARARANLCALTLEPSPPPELQAPLIRAATRQARLLGYDLSLEPLPLTRRAAAEQERSLLYRNVQGLLLLPSLRPVEIPALLDWSRFALVSIGLLPTQPDCDRVLHNSFHAVRHLLQEAQERGHRRVACLSDASLDYALRHQISTTLNNARHLGCPLTLKSFFYVRQEDRANYEGRPASYAAFLENSTSLQRGSTEQLNARFQRFLDSFRPDLLIADAEVSLQLFAGILSRPRHAHLPRFLILRGEESQVPGMTLSPARIGRGAIDLLHRKILLQDWGPGDSPSVQLVQSVWSPATCKLGAD